MDNNNERKGIENIKKQYFIKKNNDSNRLIKIKEVFEDPNKYFKKDKEMIIGNLNFNSKKKLQNKLKIKPFSLSESSNNIIDIERKKSKNIISKSKSYTQGQIATLTRKKSKIIPSNISRPKTSTLSKQNNYNINSNLNSYLHNLRNIKDQNAEFIGIHYKKKTLSEVLDILLQSKKREEKNKSKINNDLIPKEAKYEIRHSFYQQEKALRNEIKLKNNSDLLSKYLSKKIKRKEEELLFNKIEEYRLKRQVIDFIENSKSIRDKFGDNYWIADLRRPKIQNEIRTNFFNNGSKNNEPEKILEYVDKDVEFIIGPNSIKKNKYTNLFRNLSINNLMISNSGLKFPDMEKMNEIEVIGKNLVEQEYLAINKDEKKFKLYKDPLERKHKNIKEFIYNEKYEKKLKGYKNKSYRVNRSIQNNFNYASGNKDKKKIKIGLIKSQSQIEENKNSKNHISYLKEAIEILKGISAKKSIKIVSSN